MGTADADAVSKYFAVNENLLIAKYSLYTIIVSEYFAVNEILLTAKYSLYTVIVTEYFAVNEILFINREICAAYYFSERVLRS